METRQCLVGVGGWEHDTFDDCFYPTRGMESGEKLAYYARYFDVTEIRATFWDDTLGVEDALQWVDAVKGNRRFVFMMKLHSSFTHKKTFSPRTSRAMRTLLQELARHHRLGGLLMQFPYAFTFTGTNRFHLAKLAEVFSGFPMFVELRHASWNQPAVDRFFRENALQIVSSDLPRVGQYMPSTGFSANGSPYVRLHGRNEKGWLLNGLDTRYDYLYNTREIAEIRRRVGLTSPGADRTVVICNNTTGGKALANSLQLSSAMREGKPIVIPDATLRSFPFLRSIAAPSTERENLFAEDEFRSAM